MAKLIIGKLCFGKDVFQFGLELCLARAGRIAYPVTEGTASGCDVLLVTMFWYRDVYGLEAFLRKAGVRKGGRGPLIIAGGMQCAMTPRLVARMVDYVFVGDADDHLGGILDQVERGERPTHPHLFADGEPVPEPCECAPTAFSVQKGGKAGTRRIEIARGCKYRCAFCALSGLKSYREVPAGDVIAELRGHEPGALSAFAPERTCHSEWGAIEEGIAARGWQDKGQDVRLEHLDRLHVTKSMSGLRSGGRGATVGLEGISHRLRKSIGKGYSDEFILDKVGAFVGRAIGPVMLAAYFIADLPGETDDDWRELEDLFAKIEAADWSRRLTLKPVLNPLSPKPHTPLAGTPIHPWRDYEARWRRLLRRSDKDGRGWGFRIAEPLKIWGPLERVMDLLVTGDDPRAYDALIARMTSKMLAGAVPAGHRERSARALAVEASRCGVALRMSAEP